MKKVVDERIEFVYIVFMEIEKRRLSMHSLSKKIIEMLELVADTSDCKFIEFIDEDRLVERLVGDPEFMYKLESLIFAEIKKKLGLEE